jgi:hypothetical protein
MIETDEVTLKLPTGETLKVSTAEARMLARQLWELAPLPGAAPIAVKIGEAVSAISLRSKSVYVSEREYGALRLVRTDEPPQN